MHGAKLVERPRYRAGNKMIRNDQDDSSTRKADSLRPGWRGRLRIRAPEETESGETEEFVGTIVGSIPIDSNADDQDPDDAIFTVCANYRDGRFTETGDEPRFSVYLSQIADAQPM